MKYALQIGQLVFKKNQKITAFHLDDSGKEKLYYIRIYFVVEQWDRVSFRFMKKKDKKIMWQYYMIVLFGVLLLLAAGYSFRNTIEFLNRGEKTMATVTDLRTIESDGEVYSPIFTYQTMNGGIFTYELPEGTNPSAWEIGETEIVIYDPADPSNVRLYSYFRIFIWPLVFLSLALPLLVIGGGYFVAEQFLK